MKEGVTILICCLTGLAACGLLGSRGDDGPEIPGRIVFAANDEAGGSQIFVMHADGSDLRQLTRFGPDGGAADPAWSPDGRRIAYQVCTNCELGGGNYEISVVEVAGEAYDPAQVHAVTDHPARDNRPSWSPDGSRIVFASNRAYIEADSMRYRTDLYVMSADDTNLQRLTEFGFPGAYTWMGTDRIILPVTDRKTDLKDVFILDVKTSNKIPLMEDVELKAQLWIFWDSVHQQLLMVNKNHEELPVIIASYDLDGKLLQQYQLNFKQLKSATGFGWYITEE